MKRYGDRIDLFGMAPDAILVKDADAQIVRGRVTATEHSLMNGLVTYTVNPEKAKKDLNETISAMDTKGQEVPQSAIHLGLWAFTTKALQGKKLVA